MVSAASAPAPAPAPQREMLAKNSERLMKIGNRIRALLRGGTGKGGAMPSAELINLIYALARGVDFAVSAGDVPMIAADVPNILRKVYELRNEPSVRSSVMVFAISCKNACSSNWFQPSDLTYILRVVNELYGNFSTSSGAAANDIIVLGIILKIMPRYYPELKFKRLVTAMEAKVGYEVLVGDFFIERNRPLDEKIRLIVVQKENLDTSSCITSPPHVSFLINGKGVDMRTNVSMETGPQFPTDITKMLKFGANIIQAVGYFNANYIIAVAFMKSLTSVHTPTLDDCAQPVTADTADSEVLEGPSRVSLKCPISLTRMKIPIKGHLCKHYQCFDYDNYIKMNLIKPTWRCPYCNTPSNFMELRTDQKITKILQETGDDVVDVLLFADGSWKAAQVHSEKSDKHTVDDIQQTRDSVQTGSSTCVIDVLNENGDNLSTNWASGFEDTKPVLSGQDLSMLDYLPDLPISGPAQAPQIVPLHGSEVSRPIPRNPGSQAAGRRELPVPPQNPGSSRRLQPNILHCAPSAPSPILSRYQAHQVTDPSSVVAPLNNDGRTLPRAPSAAPLLHPQSTTLGMPGTSSHLPNRIVDFPTRLVGSRQPAGVPSQTGAANAYLSPPVLNELMLQNRGNQTAQAARSKTSSAAHVGLTQRNIQSHLFSGQQSRLQIVPQAASSKTIPRVPLHLQSPSEPTVGPSTSLARASGSTSELSMDENWRPTGQMRGSLTGNAYNHAIEHYLGLAAEPHSRAGRPGASEPPAASDKKKA